MNNIHTFVGKVSDVRFFKTSKSNTDKRIIEVQSFNKLIKDKQLIRFEVVGEKIWDINLQFLKVGMDVEVDFCIKTFIRSNENLIASGRVPNKYFDCMPQYHFVLIDLKVRNSENFCQN